MVTSDVKITRRILMGMWVNWALAFGSFALVLVLAFFVPKNWLPLPVAAIAYFLLIYSRHDDNATLYICGRSLRVAMKALFWSAAVMLTINILNTHMFFAGAIDWSATNHDIPYIVSLVIFPMLTLVSLWAVLRGRSNKYCVRCRRRHGFSSCNGVVSTIYYRESRYQVMMLLCFGATLTAVTVWYYFYYYININLNTPDLFFFRILPMGAYAISLVFMWMRYSNLTAVIGPVMFTESATNTLVRFLIVSGDFVMLDRTDSGRYDTPAYTEVPPDFFVTLDDARKLFKRLSGVDDFEIRFLYSTKNHDMRADVVHYAVFMPDEVSTRDAGVLRGEWFSLEQINRMLNTARLGAELCEEVYRIFTITMAWKTYDAEGRRLYPIKHYRPTFRLRDFKTWDVNYNDVNWLAVADNNQDRPFFRTRRLWNRILDSLSR